jgi:hypothetical protein
MNWMLFVVIVSGSPSDKVINSTTVPMATEQLCNAAKAKLTDAYQESKTPYFSIVIRCLQTR